MSVPSIYMVGSHIAGSGAGVFATMGSGGGSAPFVLYTDMVDGSTSGGENNLGGYLSVYGLNFGTFANLGTTAGAKVFINSIEVANYRVLDNAVTTANNAEFAVQRLICQIGSTGIQALTLGTAYVVSVVVNGVSSNTNDIFGNALIFTPISAPILFIDEVNGSDANPGTIASPKQHIQTYPGSGNMTGIMASNTSVTGGSSNGVQAGTLVVMRGGAYAAVNSHDNRFCEFFRTTGCPSSATPSGGSKGVNAGYLKVTAYPGPILGNACEVPSISGGSGAFLGNDSAEAANTTPYGQVGYASYIAISNLTISTPSANTASDGGPCNIDNGGNFWRVINNDISFPCTNHMLSGGVVGDGTFWSILGNHIHDVFCDSGLQNHGIYMDGGAVYAADIICAFNNFKNCTGGSIIQTFNQALSGTDMNGNTAISRITAAYNWGDTAAKYGLNIADVTLSGSWYGNVMMNTVSYGCRLNPEITNLAITVKNNTFYNCCTGAAGANSMIENDGDITTGFVDFYNNLVIMGAARSNTGLAFYVNFASTDTPWVRSNNQYFDPQGHATTPPSGGTNEVVGDPKVNTNWTNFSLQATSPCIGTGTTAGVAVNFDFALNRQPRAGQTNPSRGAYA